MTKILKSLLVYGMIGAMALVAGCGGDQGAAKKPEPPKSILEYVAKGNDIKAVLKTFNLENVARHGVEDYFREIHMRNKVSDIRTVNTRIWKKEFLCDGCKKAKETKGHVGMSIVEYTHNRGLNAMGVTVLDHRKAVVYFNDAGKICHSDPIGTYSKLEFKK